MDELTELARLLWALITGAGSITCLGLSLALMLSNEPTAGFYALGLSAVLAIWELSGEIQGQQ